MRSSRTTRWCAWGTWLTLCSAVLAADIEFTASVDHQTVGIDETVTLTLRVKSSGSINAPAPLPPNLNGFRIVNQSTSRRMEIVNMSVSSAVDYQYALLPQRTGRITIGAATLNYGGKVYRTRPITITVVGSSGARPTPAPQPAPSTPAQPAVPQTPGSGASGDQAAGEAFLRAEVSATEVYVNQQVLFSVWLCYRHRNLRVTQSPQPPDLTGFVAYEQPAVNPTTIQVDGVPYGCERIIGKILFPVNEGEITIAPTTFGYASFAHPNGRLLRTKPLKIKVLPLPDEGRPPDFKGAVGRYRVQAKVDKQSTKVGEPVTLTVRVTGVGNIGSVGEIGLGDVSAFRQFKSTQNEETRMEGKQLAGDKTFEYVLVPQQAGTQSIGPIRLSMFNPETGRYETADAGAIQLTVAPGASQPTDEGLTHREVQLLREEIAHIKPNLKHLPDDRPFYRRTEWWTWRLVPLAAVLLLAGVQSTRRRLAADERRQRSRRSREAARRWLHSARQAMSNSAGVDFYAALARCFSDYLGHRLQAPPADINAETVTGHLSAAGVDDQELVDEVRACLQECEFGRFAPGATDPQQMEQAWERARDCIERLERAVPG